MTSRGANITILGSGVIGLSSAIRLSESGHGVTILTDPLAERVSEVAAAFWYPFHVDGSEKLIRNWASRTHDVFHSLLAEPESGITLEVGKEFFTRHLAESEIDRFYWWRSIREVSFGPLSREEIPKTYRFRAGFRFTVPVAHMPTYLKYLEKQFKALGGTIEHNRVIDKEIPGILDQCEVLVNCTGLGSRELFHDNSLISEQGQIVCIDPVEGWEGLVPPLRYRRF